MPDEKEEYLSAYRTARGSLYSIIKNLVIGMAGSLFFMFIARFLPHVSDLGLVHGLQILILLGATFAGIGLTYAATRFISYQIGIGRRDLADAISKLIFRIGLISSFMIAFTLFVTASYIASTFFHDVIYTNLIRLSSIDVFFYSMVTLSSSILNSYQEFKRVAIVLMVNSIIKFSAASILLRLGLSIDGIVIGIIFGDVVTLLIYIWLSRHKIVGCNTSIPNHMLRSLLNYSMPMFGGIIFSFLSLNMDYYLVLILSGLFTAGVYSPAVVIGTMFVLIIAGTGETLLPYFSRIYGKSGIESLKDATIFATRYVFLINFPLGFAILASCHPVIDLVFGQRYSESIYPAIILILATTLTSLSYVFNYVLMSAGYSRVFFVSTSIALIVQIIISVISIPSLGANGAALARASAFAIAFLYPAYRLKKITGLHYDLGALQKGLIGSVIMASIIFILDYYLTYAYYLPLSLFIGFFSYLIFLRFTRAMNLHDFEIINNILLFKLRIPIRLLARIVIR